MKVFIGWSGERSQALGQALRDWMPLVLHYVEPWLSETDVAAGERWSQAVSKELEASNFGIISITRENVSSPWILFEAGALSKSMEESRVIPLLLDLELSEIGGPLAQFQAKKSDESGLREVVNSVNQVAAQPIEEARVSRLFEGLWTQLEEKLSSIPEHPGEAKRIRPQHEILEELVAGVRSLDSRVREVGEMASRRPPSRGRIRRHPIMIREMGKMMAEGPNDPILLLITASMFKDDLPWLYELGVEAYRAATTGTPEEAEPSLRRFLQAADLLERSPFAEEMGIPPREFHMMLSDLRLRRSVDIALAEEPRTRTRRRKTESEE